MPRDKIKDDRYKREHLTLRLPAYVLDWINRQDDSAGRLIEVAVIAHYGIRLDNERNT